MSARPIEDPMQQDAARDAMADAIAGKRVHAPSCPDPDELYGPHESPDACPCERCLDTGFIDADPAEIDCDCGAQLAPDDERRAACDRIARYR